jgi:hypothetical protein
MDRVAADGIARPESAIACLTRDAQERQLPAVAVEPPFAEDFRLAARDRRVGVRGALDRER